MKVVAFVPIKLNSQRLPNKMFLTLGDKKICQYIFDILLEVKKNIDMDIYCYCSDEKIIPFLPNDVIFLKRPKYLDSNETKGLDIYKNFCKNINADIYLLCHATSPFISKNSILDGVKSVLNYNYDSSFSVGKIKTYCWYKNKPLNYSLENIVKTQDIEPVYYENSAFYIIEELDLIQK